ncbi:uroporphyrinogen-III synthase [Erythrobacter rubeus]|uniref:Uroporphyrinogen-III synthase n=1 Tax=Erythrobacter rubeus TaxID=2760803 RepID=A0ABR8KP79_9SPHN|nr:uroporphyrinogen-III synthase [Erythrobacter rubeus]MBD2841230.1 uroporphyrinogen-III synthase [Erythrobacter rubeus]
MASTIDAGRAMGLPITGVPLFEIRARPWQARDPARIDGLLIGSANAIRHGGEQLQLFLDKPVHAVGKTTEKAAREAGFTVGSVGTGGLQNVLDAVAAPARLLRIAGAQHVPLDAPADITIETVIAYESVALPLERALVEWGERTIILLHSAVAATHFAAECDRLELDRGDYEIAALGPRIASAAGKGWGAIHVSENPDDAALLAMVKALCQ